MALSLSIRSAQPLELEADVTVFGVWAFDPSKKLPDAIKDVDRALGEGGLLALVKKEEFSGKPDQSLSIPTLGRVPGINRIVFLGLGDRASVKDPETRTFAARAARAALGDRAKSLVVVLPEGIEKHLRAVGEGIELGAYRFTKHLTGDRRPKEVLETVTFVLSSKKSGDGKADGKKDIALGQKIAFGVNLARDLSNEPANILTPAALANEAQKMAKANGLKIEIFDYKEIQKRGMALIDAVGRGSVNEPRFVHISYTPAKKAKKKFVFVGKGITFDTGGISIKPAQGMGEMKHDMSGAANMVGLMAAVAAVKPHVEVHALMACAENMPSGNAYRPGDVWPSLDGKSVEIINTDAEGRLVLADALAYGAQLEPDLLVDNATLTGACIVALGNTYSGWYANSEDAIRDFSDALKASGEQMWRMPLIEELREQLKSDTADLKHMGDRSGGSITAALFLREFIGKTKNWVHADIAGPATSDRATGWNAKGATGHGVLTFLSLIEKAG
ncbi:leucyl aminopeptidase [Pendulispora albinea]|uniref:Probable cytosol aminopeptidase n=1 Tax=Pendulispora albinea TaxID=2741071 RepID=A0ABZ2LYA4_9BACT